MLLTAGILLEGALYEFGVLPIYDAMAIHTTFMAIGMLAILH